MIRFPGSNEMFVEYAHARILNQSRLRIIFSRCSRPITARGAVKFKIKTNKRRPWSDKTENWTTQHNTTQTPLLNKNKELRTVLFSHLELERKKAKVKRRKPTVRIHKFQSQCSTSQVLIITPNVTFFNYFLRTSLISALGVFHGIFVGIWWAVFLVWFSKQH